MLKNGLGLFIVLSPSLFYIVYIAHKIITFMNSFNIYLKVIEKLLEH